MADDAAVTDLTEAVQIAERCSEDLPLVVLRMTLGTALTYRDSAGRERGVAMLAELRDTCIKERYGLNMVPTLELYIARTTADDDIDRAIQQTRAALEELYGWGNFANCDGGTRFLVQLLLARGTENDLLEAEAAIHRLVGTLAGSEWVTRGLFVLQLRALLARARGDDIGYREHRDRYRAMANELGFEGDMQWAREMP